MAQDYNLHGVNYHQDTKDKGWAKSDADTLADVQQMLQMGVTIIRTSHYQHSQYFYDLCDEYGIILYTETAVNGTGGNVPDNIQFFHNSADQLHELIRQNFNHPSIIVWGMHNEASSSNATNQRFMRQMNPLARAEDSTRKTTSTSTNNTVNSYDRLWRHGDDEPLLRLVRWIADGARRLGRPGGNQEFQFRGRRQRIWRRLESLSSYKQSLGSDERSE